MQLYAVQGFRNFVLLTGYKGELIDAFAQGTDWPDGVTVTCVETGLDTQTGGRIKIGARSGAYGDRPFAATYADGVADVDLAALREFHAAHEDLATMTVVRPELQFGVTEIGGDNRVAGFREKPRSDHWINGGFFIFEPGVLEYLSESSVLEREPLEGLATDGALHAFRHTGFWDCMDTYKDAVTLNDLWATGHPPWKVWP